MRLNAVMALTLISTGGGSNAIAQSVAAPVAVVSDEEFEFFRLEREECRAALPYERIEMQLHYVGWKNQPNYKWSIDADGTVVFTDYSIRGADQAGNSIVFEMNCFTQSEVLAIAKAMIEPSASKQNCVISSDHATFGRIVLRREDVARSWDFSLGCTDLENPGFNAAIRAMDERVVELVKAAQEAAPESN